MGGSTTVLTFGTPELALRLAGLGHGVRWAGGCGSAGPADASGTGWPGGGGARCGCAGTCSAYADGGGVLAYELVRGFAADPPGLLHLTVPGPEQGPGARAAAELALRLAGEHSVLVCLEAVRRPDPWARDETARLLRGWLPRVDALVTTDAGLRLCAPGSADPVAELRALGVGEVLVGRDGPAVRGDLVLYDDEGAVHRGAGALSVPGYLAALLAGAPAATRLARAGAGPAAAGPAAA
ncbi:hypothetical protein [Streptomyces sp. NPDC089919]|uniref:hypothetical protein n=1 Tax=Streptomyces sp. NPDC089919 TaxID=3155188 RepID=UPI0034240326